MVNRHRGEIEAMLDGARYRLCLTLGALAELEAAFGHEDMLALAIRFEKGRLSATDAIRIIAAGLKGGGTDIGEAQVARMPAQTTVLASVACLRSLGRWSRRRRSSVGTRALSTPRASPSRCSSSNPTIKPIGGAEGAPHSGGALPALC